MKVTLYSTHCPKCNVLKAKLDQKNIDYEEVDDMLIMREKGFQSVPKLEVDGTVYEFTEAVQWIREQ